jgi:hypothetical protein
MPRAREEHTLPAVHALHLAELVQRWGVRDALLEGTGLREDALADPDARLSVRTFEAIVERARSLTGGTAARRSRKGGGKGL